MSEIITLARNFRWLELSRRRWKIVAIAKLDGLAPRIVSNGIAAALAAEAEVNSSNVDKKIKLPKDRPPPYTLEPLVHMNGLTYREDVCPRHPGKRLTSPGITEVHSNPLYVKWNKSNFCCLSCMRSGQDIRIHRDPKDDPKRIALPEKPKAKQTRKERRAKKNAAEPKSAA